MREMKILLVEDAPDVQLLVKAALAKKFSVKCVVSAEEATVELHRNQYALLILDVALPGEDGFKLCANIRADQKHGQIPIVFLTGKKETRDKVLAFSIGADDYIVKPIDPSEFQARIEAKMRRIQMDEEQQFNFSKGPFRVAMAEQKIFVVRSGEETDLALSTLEFKLLYYFLRHEEHVLSREQILNEVWSHNTHVGDRTVDTHVYALRKKLGEFAAVIQSVSRVGYRMSQTEIKKSA